AAAQGGGSTYHVSESGQGLSEDGSYTVAVSVRGEGPVAHTVPALHAALAVSLSARSATLAGVNEGDASATVEVATFTHAAGVEDAAHFTAPKNRRSGTGSASVTPDGSGTYHVSPSRPVFSAAGSYTVTVPVSD